MPLPFFSTFATNSTTITTPSPTPCFSYGYQPPLLDPTNQYALRQLRQTGSVSDFQRQFETISRRVLAMSARDHLDCFISGLRDDISRELRLRRPYSLSHAIGLAQEIEATPNLPKPTEITKTHSPCVIQPPLSKFHVSAKAPIVTGDDGTTQSQEEDNLSADPISNVAKDQKEFLPGVFKDSKLSTPVLVPSKRVLGGFETHSTDLSPVLVPLLLDVVSPIRFNPQSLPANSASKSPKERKGSLKVTEQWVFDIPAELNPTEIPPPEPPDRVVVRLPSFVPPLPEPSYSSLFLFSIGHVHQAFDVLYNSDNGCGLRFCWSKSPRGSKFHFYANFNGHSVMRSSGGYISPNLKPPKSLSMKFQPQSHGDWVGHVVIIRYLCGALSIARRTSFYPFLGSRGINVKKVDSVRINHPDQVNGLVLYGLTLNGVLICKGDNGSGPLSVPFGLAPVFSGLALGATFTGATVSRNGLVVCCGGIGTSAIKLEFDNAVMQGVSFGLIVVSLVFVCGLPTKTLSLYYWGPDWSSVPHFPNDVPLRVVLPGPCAKDACSSCGVYPNSNVLCYGSWTSELHMTIVGTSIVMQLLLREWPNVLVPVWPNVFCKQLLWPLFHSLLPLSLNLGGMFKRSLRQIFESAKELDGVPLTVILLVAFAQFAVNGYTLYITAEWQDLHTIIILQLYKDMLAPGAKKSAHVVWFFNYIAIDCVDQFDEEGDLYAVTLLISKGDDANISDTEDYNPLMLVAQEGHSSSFTCSTGSLHFKPWDPGGCFNSANHNLEDKVDFEEWGNDTHHQTTMEPSSIVAGSPYGTCQILEYFHFVRTLPIYILLLNLLFILLCTKKCDVATWLMIHTCGNAM